MKRPLLLSAVFGLASIGMMPQAVIAAPSQNECAIWLCLPSGFPNGCGAAKSAMKHRLKKGKSPLPSLSACMVKDEHTDPKDFSYTDNRMLQIKEHRECTSWATRRRGRDGEERYCESYKTVPAHYRPGTSCQIKHGSGKDADYEDIPGCSRVVREIKVYEKGKLIGNPYRF